MQKVRSLSVVVLLSVTACSGVSDVVARPLQGQASEDFSWQGTMRPGATLEIKGINGSVEAIPASGGIARVDAVKTARRGGDPNDVQIVVVEHAGGVTICAVPPSRGSRPNVCAPGDEGRLSSRNLRVQVAFTVEVPAGVAFVGKNTNGDIEVDELAGRVEAYSTNGDVSVGGGTEVIARTTNGSISVRSAGEADARTTNGRITADLRRIDPSGQPLRFSTTNGSVTVRIPSRIDASISARTTNGVIESEVPITIGRASRRELTGTIGNGGREIELRTTNGNIVVERGS